MAKTTPQEGFVDVTLARPLSINGTEVKALRMREPTVADQLVAEEMKGSDSAKELAVFANLCEITPDDMKKLTLRDYKKLQTAYVGFFV